MQYVGIVIFVKLKNLKKFKNSINSFKLMNNKQTNDRECC